MAGVTLTDKQLQEILPGLKNGSLTTDKAIEKVCADKLKNLPFDEQKVEWAKILRDNWDKISKGDGLVALQDFIDIALSENSSEELNAATEFFIKNPNEFKKLEVHQYDTANFLWMGRQDHKDFDGNFTIDNLNNYINNKGNVSITHDGKLLDNFFCDDPNVEYKNGIETKYKELENPDYLTLERQKPADVLRKTQESLAFETRKTQAAQVLKDNWSLISKGKEFVHMSDFVGLLKKDDTPKELKDAIQFFVDNIDQLKIMDTEQYYSDYKKEWRMSIDCYLSLENINDTIANKKTDYGTYSSIQVEKAYETYKSYGKDYKQANTTGGIDNIRQAWLNNEITDAEYNEILSYTGGATVNSWIGDLNSGYSLNKYNRIREIFGLSSMADPYAGAGSITSTTTNNEPNTSRSDYDAATGNTHYVEIDTLNLKNTDTNKELITEQVKRAISDDGKIIKSEVVGSVKEGFELFDLNGDKIVDDTEWEYFSSGGTIHRDGDDSISLQDFSKSVKNIDKFDFNKDGIAETDGKISGDMEKKLYKIIETGHFIADNLTKAFSSTVRDEYLNTLDKVDITGSHYEGEMGPGGYAIKIGENRRINMDGVYPTLLVHELTHIIQADKNDNMPRVPREAQAFYMEAIFSAKACDNDNDPLYFMRQALTNKDHSLTRADVATQEFVNNACLIGAYSHDYELSEEEIKKQFENPQYVKIGDMDWSASAYGDFH